MAKAAAIDKAAVLAALRARVDADLAAIERSQLDAQAGATHEEARAENDKDTRALETSYLARGLAKRVVELREAATLLATLALRRFGDGAPAALSALVTVEDDDGAAGHYFVAPAGGGLEIVVGRRTIRVVTPGSPLGQALAGKRAGDELELRTPQGVRALVVVAVA